MQNTCPPITKKIKWFTTGGTIDANAYPKGETPPIVDNPIFSYLPTTLQTIREQIRPDFPIELEQLWTRDSKYIKEREVLAMVKRIRSDKKHDVIVITHGTDTMPQNSRLFMKHLDGWLKEKGKTLIMTGAMEPLTHGDDSDGINNLKFIVKNYDDETIFPPGVHVVMHGEVFSPIGLRKDFEKKIFSTTADPKELKKDKAMLGAVYGVGA